MTTNERFIAILRQRGLDTRPDSRLNTDSAHVAQALGVSRWTVVSWLSPTHWRSYRKMPPVYLEKLEWLSREQA